MATLLASASAATGNATLDTTSANAIVVGTSSIVNSAPTDSLGNSGTLVASRQEVVSTAYVALWLYENPTTSVTHSFASPFSGFSSVYVQAWDGFDASPIDQTNNNAASSVTSLQPGSITPSQDDCVVVSQLSVYPSATTSAHNISGLTSIGARPAVSGAVIGGDQGYAIQTTAVAINPTFSWTTAVGAAAVIASFKTIGSAPTVYTLTADHGAFTLSGQAAALLHHRVLSASHGVFALSGQVAGLLYGHVLPADYGAFTLSGQAATLQLVKLLTADYGTFTLAGQSASLLYHRMLTANHGTFAFSGQTVALLVSHVLSAEHGTFVLSGQDATLTYTPVGSYSLTADAGSFLLTGQAATLLYNRMLSADAGSFALNGQDAILARALRLVSDHGTFLLSGQDAALQLSRLLSAEHGLFTLSGQIATLAYSGQGDVVVRFVRIYDSPAYTVSLSDRAATSIIISDGLV